MEALAAKSRDSFLDAPEFRIEQSFASCLPVKLLSKNCPICFPESSQKQTAGIFDRDACMSFDKR